MARRTKPASSVKRQRILWYSNAAFTPTGYGVQTAQVVDRLKRDQHEVAIAANYGLQGAETSWNGTRRSEEHTSELQSH